MPTFSMQTVLDALPDVGECVKVCALSEITGLSRKKIVVFCDRLRQRGLVERPETGCFKLTQTGKIARDAGMKLTSGPNGPHTGRRKTKKTTARARLWRAMRTIDKFTVPDLLTMIDDVTVKCGENNAQSYLRILHAAGYVQKLKLRERGTEVTSPGYIRWTLVPDKNTGPEAPVYSGLHDELYDPNLGKVVWHKEKSDG